MKKHRGIALVVLLFTLSPRAFPCTIFMAARNGVVLAANNSDFLDPDTEVWFIPASPGKHGRAYFGYGVGLPMGGVNDQGLFFDTPATPPHTFESAGSKEIFKGDLRERALEECATVEDALKLFSQYDLKHMREYQAIFVDRTGDSVIIEGDAVVRKTGDHQVVANFRQSLKEPQPYSIERYMKAETMLRNSGRVSAEFFRSILAAVHQEPGEGSPTEYSKICNLKTGDMYIYHFHNYADVARLNLDRELKKGEHSYEIRSLFPQTTFAFDTYAKNNKVGSPPQATVSTTAPGDVTGDYEVDPPERFLAFSVTQENGKLFGRIRGLAKYELTPESDTTYYCRALKSRWSFIRDNSGEISSLVLDFFGVEKTSAKKIK